MIKEEFVDILINNETDFLNKIKNNEINLKDKTNDGWNILQLASLYNKKDIAEFCLNNFNYDEINNENEHPLKIAFEENSNEVIDIFLSNNYINKIDKNFKLTGNENLLYLAIYYNKIEEAKEIFKNNKKLYSEKNKNGQSPFSLAIENSQKELIELFVNDDDIIDIYNDTYLMLALNNNNVDLFEKLYQFKEMSTDDLFNEALIQEKPEILNFILNTGDILLGEEQLTKLISIACKNFNNESEKTATGEIISYLFSINVPFSKFKNESGQNAWMLAINNNNMHVIRELLKTNESVNVADNANETPLFYAINKENKECVLELLKKRANVNIKNHYGNTPLIIATVKKQKEIVDLILQYGPTINETNKNNDHALGIAIKNRNIPIVDSLIWNGAQITLNPITEVVQSQFWKFSGNGNGELFNYHHDNLIDGFIALSKLGLKLNRKNENGDSLLLNFIKNGYFENFKALLKCVISPNETNLDKENAFTLAAQKNNSDYLGLLYQRYSVDDYLWKNKDGKTLIDLCIDNSSLTKIEIILKDEAKIPDSEKNKINKFLNQISPKSEKSEEKVIVNITTIRDKILKIKNDISEKEKIDVKPSI